MLHTRTASDAVPVLGAASRRALTAVRSSYDEAPGMDGGLRVLVLHPVPQVLADLLVDLELLLLTAEVESRAPPKGVSR